MKQQLTHNWSYHIISKTEFNFYHALISSVTLEEIKENISFCSTVLSENDGSISIFLAKEGHLQQSIAELSLFLEDVEADYLQTPNKLIKPVAFNQRLLHEWYYSLIGGLALVLLTYPSIADHCHGNWEYHGLEKHGLYLDPFTISISSEGVVRVIDPVKVQNYAIREQIENIASESLSTMFVRLIKAYPGYEGEAILSYLQEKTSLPSQSILSHINRKMYRTDPDSVYSYELLLRKQD